MVRKKKETFVDLGRVESEKYEPTREVKQEFDEAARLAGRGHPSQAASAGRSSSRDLPNDDVDATGDDAATRKPSAIAGEPAQVQSEVEELGEAVGLTYADDEPLHTTDKVEDRDRHRWELDPASSEGFDERMKHEGEYEEK